GPWPHRRQLQPFQALESSRLAHCPHQRPDREGTGERDPAVLVDLLGGAAKRSLVFGRKELEQRQRKDLRTLVLEQKAQLLRPFPRASHQHPDSSQPQLALAPSHSPRRISLPPASKSCFASSAPIFSAYRRGPTRAPRSSREPSGRPSNPRSRTWSALGCA